MFKQCVAPDLAPPVSQSSHRHTSACQARFRRLSYTGRIHRAAASIYHRQGSRGGLIAMMMICGVVTVTLRCGLESPSVSIIQQTNVSRSAGKARFVAEQSRRWHESPPRRLDRAEAASSHVTVPATPIISTARHVHVHVCHDMCVMVAADHTTWTKAHVQLWLAQREMHFAIDVFCDNSTTGIVLADLDHEALQEVGLTKKVHRLQVLKEIGRLMQSSSSAFIFISPHDGLSP